MYQFPEEVYSDIRIEDIDESMIAYTTGNLDQYKSRKYQAAFIRVFDGNKWFYTALTELDNIQKELDTLAEFAVRDQAISENPVVKGFEANKGKFITFDADDISKVTMEEKNKLLTKYFELLNSNEYIKTWKAIYVDRREVKKFYSSKGADLEFDSQRCGYGLMFSMAQGEKLLDQSYQQASNIFSDLEPDLNACSEKLDKCVDFMLNSKTIDPGKYTVILSPMTAGVFAHESFGHKSEADF
ncbi:TldD/PmbA family protein, partial [bacterium]|nr:TldD/PmbA family protein [bacterium]